MDRPGGSPLDEQRCDDRRECPCLPSALPAAVDNNVAVNPRDLTKRAPTASTSPEETAAIIAAIERFVRATAPTDGAPAQLDRDGWREMAILDGVSRDPWAGGDGWLRARS